MTVILKMTVTWVASSPHAVRDHGGGRVSMIGQEAVADGGRLGGGALLAGKTRPYHDAGWRAGRLMGAGGGVVVSFGARKGRERGPSRG